MANIKISALPLINTPLLTDIYPVVQGTVTYKETMAQLQTLMGFVAGILPLANGGTSASLTADNGGIVYSTASAFSILPHVTVAGKVLQSGNASAPSWSIPTYPSLSGTLNQILKSDGTNVIYSTSTYSDSYTTNNLLFASATNTVSGLATANNGVLITSGAGVPSISSTLPAAVQANITTVGTITSGVWNGSNIDLAHGGTNASLIASNGGIFYSTASAGAILAGTATSNQMLQSGASGAPSWSTATWPATTTANQILYSSSTNTVAGLPPFTNSVLVSTAGGVPVFSPALPVPVQANITTVGTVTTGTWNATNIDLGHGGTNASLTASNGGIFYSTATAGAILSGTATAGQILQSGSSSAPAWSTPTYPSASGTSGTILRSNGTNNVYSTSTFSDTYTINNILFASGANTVTGLATANNGVLITSAGGVPSISSTLPAAVQGNITSVGTITSGTWNGTNIDLAHGGTNASLTASNGGIFYSTGTAGAILAGTATAGQMLQSGASTTPSWSTPTYPSASGTAGQILRSNGTNNVYSTSTFADTYAINTILFASAANTVTSIATQSSSGLLTNGAGLPAWVTVTGTGAPVLATSPTLVTPNIGAATATSISNGDGSAASPSYFFTSDTDTGIYRVSENNIGITNGGSNVATFGTTASLSLQTNLVEKYTATTITVASTVTGAQLFGGIIACTSGGAFTLTLDTAANIFAAMGSPNYVGASFVCRIVANGGANATIATNTGLTLVLGSTSVNNDMRTFVFVVTNTATPTITVYGG